MKRFLLSVAMLLPSVCWASGDVAVFWWIGGTALVYVAVAVLLVMFVLRKQAGVPRLLLFGAAAAGAWFWYLNSESRQIVLQTVLLVVLAAAFLLGTARK